MDHKGVFLTFFFANVSCRISRASRGISWTPGSTGRLKARPDYQLQGCHCMLYLKHNMYTLRDLQTKDLGGKRINFDKKTQGKMGGNDHKLRENDIENSVRTLRGVTAIILRKQHRTSGG